MMRGQRGGKGGRMKWKDENNMTTTNGDDDDEEAGRQALQP